MRMTLFRNKPMEVEGALFDGTEASAEFFCQKYPQFFVIGINKDDTFGGLFIQTGDGILPVVGGDMVFRGTGDGGFCSMDEDSFFKYFDCDADADVDCEDCMGCSFPEVTD